MLGQLLATLLVVGAAYQAAQWLRATPSVHGAAVVIVGASSGIGRSLALEYARSGAQLLLCARRAPELNKVREECSRLSPHAVRHVVGDITRSETQDRLVEAAQTHFGGRVDYVVLNAGSISVQQVVDLWGMRGNDHTLRDASPEAITRADTAMRAIMEINVFAPVRVAGLFLPMLARARGVIVVVSSMAGLVAAPTRSLYSASKHAVSGYFAALRMEVRALGVDVTIAYPGTVDTELRRSAVDGDGGRAAGSERGKLSPLKCARQILRAAALRQPSLVTPAPYWLSSIVHAFAPGLVEYLARRKYGL